MGINQRPGPGESVYRTKLGGEAAGEDDVEGHGWRMLASDEEADVEVRSMSTFRKGASDDDDVEGHKAGLLRATEDEDSEGHRFRKLASDDDDVEGHRAGLLRATEEDEDTEGHAASSRPLIRADDDEDTEGHRINKS